MMIIILTLLVLCHQGAAIIQHPIGPIFVSTIAIKQKLYYNNLGVRLDCSATGYPIPVITWFRTNNTNNPQWIPVQSSELIDVFQNGSLFIRPFQEYIKSIHASSYICRAENPAGSIQTIPIQLKPQIYDAYEIEVKTPYGFEHSSVIISCEISPPLASSYVKIIGWLEKVDDKIVHLDLRPRTKYNLLSNKNLIIHNLTKSDDNRSYACFVQNQIDNNTKQSRFKSLRVRDHSPFGPELSISNNTEYQAQAGNLIELPCGISSLSTNTQVSWWKDGIEIEYTKENVYNNSLILQLSSSSSNDSGNYACRVDDESIGRLTSVIALKVNVPTKCQMDIQQTDINAGSHEELICTINSLKYSPVHWQWYHNSMLLSSKLDRYMISNATRKQMGIYQCCFISSSSDLQSCCAQTQIRVINSPPVIVHDQQTNSNSITISSATLSHIPIDLDCTIYGDPVPDLTIFKDGQKLPIDYPIEYLPSGDIFLHYPIYVSSLNDTGLYECSANNSFGSISLSKHVNIENQKPFIQPLSNRIIRTGQQFTLSCYASGQPNLYLQWIDQTNNRIINTSSTSPILFTSINTSPNVYTCQATNPYGQTSVQVLVTVQIPAKILSVTSNKTIKINESLNIYCSAEGDNQLDLILKGPSLKKLNTVENQYEHKRNSSIIINNIQMSDNGVYECQAKNNYSEDHSVFEVIVQDVPDRIKKIFIENSERIFWIKPFDGNAHILKYLLKTQYKQGLSWSNSTIITVDNNHMTTYSFENIFSTCTISVIIQSVNIIGLSLPSDPFQFQTNVKHLRVAPYNLIAGNISSNSVMLKWQYPSSNICNDSLIRFVIEIIDQYNQTKTQNHTSLFTTETIHQLQSFTYYTFVIYAINELGASPKSKPMKIQTLESVPLAMIRDLTATLLNSSMVYISWMFDQEDLTLLNGKFRTFTVTIYENFNMSTLTTIETINSNLVVPDLHSSSQYFISVSVCNFFDCGTSSLAIDIKTPSSIFDSSTTILHPMTKPLIIDCPLSSNNSLSIPRPSLSQTDDQYQCGSKLFHIRYYDKPSSIQTILHYTMPDEIGLKIIYPPEIIESLTVTYKIQDTSLLNEMNIFPPLLNIRLTNLSCGNIYEIMIYASNQAGFSLTNYLITKTTGSVPSVIESSDLLQTISNNYIILNMVNWIIHECPILSYEIELLRNKTNLSRYFSYENPINEIKISNLQANEDYQLIIKVHSQAGLSTEIISFRTTNKKNSIKDKNEQILVLIISFLLVFLLVMIVIKFCRRHWKNTDLFVNRKRKLKPVLCSSESKESLRNYRQTWFRPADDYTIGNSCVRKSRSSSFISEDSQGNINPYAVTTYTTNNKNDADYLSSCREKNADGYQLHSTDTRPSTAPSERFFRPIILESSFSNDPNSSNRNPLIRTSDKPLLPNIHFTVSSSQTEVFSAFTNVSSSKRTAKKYSHHDQSSSSADSGVHSSYTQSPRCPLQNFSFDRSSLTNQGNPLYATYDETTLESYKRHQYSLV